MTKKQKYLTLLFVAPICFAITFFNNKKRIDKHERLDNIGIKTPIYARLVVMKPNSAAFYFITKDNIKISGFEKCGNEFEKYKNASVIYNPHNPNEYELSFNFEHYFPTWIFIFNFILVFPFMTLFGFTLVKISILVYNKLTSKEESF